MCIRDRLPGPSDRRKSGRTGDAGSVVRIWRGDEGAPWRRDCYGEKGPLLLPDPGGGRWVFFLYTSCFIQCRNQQGEQFMVEPVNLLIVKIIVVKLGVIMGLHEASACKVVDHGRDTGNGHGKIIGPCLLYTSSECTLYPKFLYG